MIGTHGVFPVEKKINLFVPDDSSEIGEWVIHRQFQYNNFLDNFTLKLPKFRYLVKLVLMNIDIRKPSTSRELREGPASYDWPGASRVMFV